VSPAKFPLSFAPVPDLLSTSALLLPLKKHWWVPEHLSCQQRHQHTARLPASNYLTVPSQGVPMPLKPPWTSFTAETTIFSYFHSPSQVKAQLQSPEGCLIAGCVKKLGPTFEGALGGKKKFRP